MKFHNRRNIWSGTGFHEFFWPGLFYIFWPTVPLCATPSDQFSNIIHTTCDNFVPVNKFMTLLLVPMTAFLIAAFFLTRTAYWVTGLWGHCGPENLKEVQAKKKLVKSNKPISRNFFLTKIHFLQCQKWPKINLWTGKMFKTARNAISWKK